MLLHLSQAIVEAAALNEDGKRRQVIVTGCLAQRYGPSLAEGLPEADLVMGFQNYGNLPEAVAERLGMQGTASSSSRVQVGLVLLDWFRNMDVTVYLAVFADRLYAVLHLVA